MKFRNCTPCFIVVLVCVFLLSGSALADSPAEKLLRKPADWFQSAEGKSALRNVLSWQTDHGDWPKNIDTTRRSNSNDSKKPSGTFDNGATCGELRLLARAFQITEDDQYQQAFLRGFDHILNAQYSNGGWPQHYPLSNKYHRHITFNDGTMIRIMEFLQDTAHRKEYQFLDSERREAANTAVKRGIECILNCQVIVNSQQTVWCAQHDAETLDPVQARSYELPSLSGAESAGILRFLMKLEDPSPEVILAINAGVDWFKQVQINGYRYRKNKTGPALVKDAAASPLWARFYEIETFRPIFCDRDGIKKYDLQQIGEERRGGYTWYGNWGSSVIKEHAKWSKRIDDSSTLSK